MNNQKKKILITLLILSLLLMSCKKEATDNNMTPEEATSAGVLESNDVIQKDDSIEEHIEIRINPNEVVKVVSKIGRKRCKQAAITAS